MGVFVASYGGEPYQNEKAQQQKQSLVDAAEALHAQFDQFVKQACDVFDEHNAANQSLFFKAKIIEAQANSKLAIMKAIGDWASVN